MLVGQSTAEFVLVKAIIYTFSYLGLACLVYFFLVLSIGGVRWAAHPVSIIIETVGAIEILFYLFWFLPYRHYLHRQRASFPPPLTREQRQELFFKSLAATPDVELYAKKWMSGASVEDLRRENLKEWLLWALFDREGSPGDDDEELEGYVDAIGEALGRKIKPGIGPAKSIRLNFDRFTITHRALLYYFVVGAADFITTITLLMSGFYAYRQPRSAVLDTFPIRPFTLFARKQSASPNLSYFYRPHASSKYRPIVLIHGVGVGLVSYLPLILMLPKEIGILAIEVLPISSRITTRLPLSVDLMREIGDIVSQQSLAGFVFVGHSYGTFFTKLFIQSSYLSSRMSRIIMIDPVAVLLHLPDVAYNFTKREPIEANELELWWAAQTEPGIAFTIGRRFCWHEHVVWREDLLNRPTTLIIGGRDCIVNPEAIAAYITKAPTEGDATSPGTKPDLQWTWQDREWWKTSPESWTGEGLELIWLEGYDHGQAFLSPKMLPTIVRTIEKYCDKGGQTKLEGDAEQEEAEVAEPSGAGTSAQV